MDDFGTGYSSLSNLRAFPFDKVKIDKSFIRNVQDDQQAATIIRAIVGLCRGLNLSVLAEGVETEAELKFLETELCVEAQGFLWGKPGDIRDFAVQGRADVEEAAGRLGVGKADRRQSVGPSHPDPGKDQAVAQLDRVAHHLGRLTEGLVQSGHDAIEAIDGGGEGKTDQNAVDEHGLSVAFAHIARPRGRFAHGHTGIARAGGAGRLGVIGRQRSPVRHAHAEFGAIKAVADEFGRWR
jgi:hypothetical protein